MTCHTWEDNIKLDLKWMGWSKFICSKMGASSVLLWAKL